MREFSHIKCYHDNGTFTPVQLASLIALDAPQECVEEVRQLYQGRRNVFAKKILAEAKVAVSPGVGFGEYGDDHVRFALIENEERTRQAVRGIKDMFRKDGLL